MRPFVSFALFSAASALAASGLAMAACGGTSVITISPEAGVTDGGPVFEASSEDAGPDGPSAPLTVSGVYAARKVYLGETERTGVVVRDAWKKYGENLDGLVSTSAAPGLTHCKRFQGADSSKHEDGLDGIDNAWGRTILSFILGLAPTPTNTANGEIAKGARTFAITLVPGSAGAPARAGLFTLAASASAPKFDGTDVRSAAVSSVGGSADAPNAVSSTPKMAGRLVASGVASGTYVFELAIQGATWRIPLRFARVTMTVSDDGATATGGTLAGIIPTEDLVNEIATVAGRISTQLCSGSTLDTIKTTIRQASDIMVDGTQDPTRECDAISFGIGFDAVKVSVAGTAPEPAPLPDPCR